ncbi:hypothetical protein AQ490_11775 [Wenjunlia vitaminophila]|uniref:Protein-L-isoaspartate O-methyltransferase n=1 Tax=Wenjunlia vitaminophila TaxID=76728 RepID=A0A0T6LL39_WENVI|nr:methyltransferase domain-containing protein [Wenjunlia vitaminophila]KRV46556.1 hypothetical protein AQ490_11775 [Wenjunlia vitaminophila]
MTTTTSAASAAELRRLLVEQLADQGALCDPAWRAAFAAVPRETFVPSFSVRQGSEDQLYQDGDAGYLAAVYSDTSLTTQRDTAGCPTSSSSQPSLMSRMLEALNVDEGPVLEVGTGTGYNAALLCHRFGDDQVVSVDIDPELTHTARDRLAELGYRPTLLTADGTAGAPERGPYNGLLATCSVTRVPVAWLRQVKPGGVIVVNLGSGIAQLTVTDERGAIGGFLSGTASFMAARPTATHPAPHAPRYTALIANAEGEPSTEDLHGLPADGLGQLVLSGSAMPLTFHQPDVLGVELHADTGTIYGLVHPATESWVRATAAADGTARVVRGGPLDLWTDRVRLLREWIAAGRPGPDAYRLTVEPTGEHHLTHI